MNRIRKGLELAIAVFFALFLTVSSNEGKAGYGNSWLLFVDDQSNTYVLNFSVLPGRGMNYGRPIFHLYTSLVWPVTMNAVSFVVTGQNVLNVGNNPKVPETLTIPAKNSYINSTYFNKSQDINVLTHGWMSSEKTDWIQSVKDNLLLYNHLNVITVDWGALAKNILYPWSALSTRYVGKQIAKFLDACTFSYDVQRDRMHLIGHSLGAQVMGYAGMFMNSEVRRITGLDPARPMFESPLLPAEFRLDKSDAVFVDIIHTNGGFFGYKYSSGHADFYPNGGSVQPGCGVGNQFIDSCSHGRSTIYFNESIEYIYGKGFMAYACSNWTDFTNDLCTKDKTSMGYNTDTSIIDDFYLHTNNASKYAIE